MFLLIKHFAYITVIFSRGANNFKRMEKIIAGKYFMDPCQIHRP